MNIGNGHITVLLCCFLRGLFKVVLIALASLSHFFLKEASDTKLPNNQRHKQYSNIGKNHCVEPVTIRNIICCFHKKI